jgi:5-methylthioadenosine/S-adenosylhomocysteine deaminase
VVMTDDRLTTIDERAVLDELQARGPELRRWQDHLEQLNRALLPAFDRQYREVMSREVPVNRFSGGGEYWLN